MFIGFPHPYIHGMMSILTHPSDDFELLHLEDPMLPDTDNSLDQFFPLTNCAQPSAFPFDEQEGEPDEMVSPTLKIDSFVPVIDQLSNAIRLSDDSIHIRGAISEADLEALCSYTRKVGTFILTDSPPDQEEYTISPGTYIRLAQLHNSKYPFFPSLKHLQVIDADSSLSLLNFLLTNSLRSLELVNLADSNKEVFSSFLITLADECPRLSSITLGQDPGRRLSSSLLNDCLKFSHLAELELKDVLASIDFELLVTIGKALPALESFILNGRTTTYSPKPLAIPLTLLRQEEHAPDGSTPVMAQSSFTGEPTSSPLVDEGALSSPPQAEKADASPQNFLLLKKLHVTGELALIKDLIPYVGSTVLEDMALTLVRSIPPRIITKTTSTWKGGRGRKQQLTTTVIDEEGPFFVSIVVEAVLKTWNTTLTKLNLSQHEDYPTSADAPSGTLQSSVLRILSHPTLEHLEISGWKLDSLYRHLHPTSLSVASSKLKVLHFPVGIANEGIPLARLRFIAESFPNIVSFQSTIDDLQSIPTYSRLEGAGNALSHGLEILSVGNASENSNPQEILDIARHIFVLFPNLKEIRTHEGQNEEQWKYIHSLVQMFQIVRLDDAARPRAL